MLTIETARSWYVDSDPVHDFDHVLRVTRMAERLAVEEGADLEIVRAAALLHDAVGAAPSDETRETEASRASHHHQSADFARVVLEGEGWPEERIAAVQHCIRAHRFRDNSEPPASLEAKILFDADKLDVLGAIGAARAVVYAALAGQPFYADPSGRFTQTGQREPGEPHSAYHEYLFKLSKVAGRMFTTTARSIALQRQEYLRAFFDRLAAETRGEL